MTTYQITYYDDCGEWLYTCKDKSDYDTRIAILNDKFDRGLINAVRSTITRPANAS